MSDKKEEGIIIIVHFLCFSVRATKTLTFILCEASRTAKKCLNCLFDFFSSRFTDTQYFFSAKIIFQGFAVASNFVHAANIKFVAVAVVT